VHFDREWSFSERRVRGGKLVRLVGKQAEDRQNTIVCCFDLRSPRITAFHIHEWIHTALRLAEDDVQMIQIDGPRRRVYIKFISNMRMQEVLLGTREGLEYKHDNGELSQVRIEIAGMGLKKVRIANLPPELADRMVRDTLAQYGEVRAITEEQWTNAYRYRVSNGVRIVEMSLRKHLPSHMNIANNRVLVSYEGQPSTCYGCGDTGHQYQECPQRKSIPTNDKVTSHTTWADIVTRPVSNTALSLILEKPKYDARAERTETPEEMAHDTHMEDPHDNPQEQLGPDPVNVLDTTMGRDPQGDTQPYQRVVKWMDTPETTIRDEVQDDTDGTCGLQGQPPTHSEHDRPLTCGISGQDFDASSYATEEPLDMADDNQSRSDEDIQPHPCPGSPKRTKKLRTERETSSLRERTRSKIRTMIQQRK
jgi:hypothetical protein